MNFPSDQQFSFEISIKDPNAAMASQTLFLLTLGCLLEICFATYGVDVSSLTSQTAFSCLNSYGYDFAVVRVCKKDNSD
jgi:hypothetical protein